MRSGIIYLYQWGMGGGMSHANYGRSVELGLGADAEIPNSATRS